MGRSTMKVFTFFVFTASALVLVPATFTTPSSGSLLKSATGGEAESKTQIQPTSNTSEDEDKETLEDVKPHARGRDLVSNISKEYDGRSRGTGSTGTKGFTFPGPTTTYLEVKKPIESGRDSKNNKDYLKSTASTAHEEEDREANEQLRGPDYAKTSSQYYEEFSPYSNSPSHEAPQGSRPSKGEYPYEFDKETTPYSQYNEEEYHPMSHYKGQKYYYPKYLSRGKQTQYYKGPQPAPQNEYSHTVNHIDHGHGHEHYGQHGTYVEHKGNSFGSGFGKALQVLIPSALFLTGVSALFPKKVKVPIDNIDPNSNTYQEQQLKNPYFGNIGSYNQLNGYGYQYKRSKRSTSSAAHDEDYVEVPSKLMKIEHRMADEYDYLDEFPAYEATRNTEKRALNSYSGPKSIDLGPSGYLPTPDTRVAAAAAGNGRAGFSKQIEEFKSQFDELFSPIPSQNIQAPKRQNINLYNHRVIQPIYRTSTSTASTSTTENQRNNLRNRPTQTTTTFTASRIPDVEDTTEYYDEGLTTFGTTKSTPQVQQQTRQQEQVKNNERIISSPVPSIEAPIPEIRTPTPRRRFNNLKPYIRKNNLLKVTQYNLDGSRSEVRLPQRSLAREIIEENEKRKSLTTSTPRPPPRPTTTPQPTEFDLSLDSPVMGLLTNYAVHDNESPDCQKKALCELAQKGSKPSGTKFERFLWTLAELVPPSLSGMYDLEDIFGAIRTKSCSAYVCENPNVIIQE